LISCQIGRLAVGASAKITLVVNTTLTGSLTNTATTVGNQPETNAANNTAIATTRVNAPFTPPVLPKADPPPCHAISVTPRNATAGHHLSLHVRVTSNGKPIKGARVEVRGPGIWKLSGKTNRQGRVIVSLKP